MAYKSMFQPITQAVFENFQQSHGYTEVPYQPYDERSVVNEEEGVQVGAQAPQQPQTPAQPQTQPQGQQGGQQPQAQGQAPAQPAQPAQGGQQGGQQPQGQIIQPNAITSDQTWQAYNQNPSYETFKAFFDKLSQVAQKMDQTFGGQQGGQGGASAANGGQQPQAQPQAQAPAQPAQGGQQPQATAQNSSVNYRKKYKTYMSLYEAEDASTGATSEKEDDKTEPKKDATETKDGETKSTPKTDDNVPSGVKYDSEYKADQGGSEKDFGWDKQMHDSIFGGQNDFEETGDVKYSSEYNDNIIQQSDANKVKWNIEPTKPNPFKPEKPSFTSLSNPNALSKTVFTSEKPDIKDAPAVGSQAPAAGAGDSKTGGSGNSSSSDSKSTEKKETTESSEKKEVSEPKKEEKSKEETPKKPKDDGSDEDANESFFTNYDSFLNESHVSDDIKRVVVQEFLNFAKGEFNIGDFHGWLSDNYPQIASDPNAFDELASDAENGVSSGEFYEENDPEIDGSDNDDEIIDSEEDVTLEEIVNEYMDQYEGEEYDEEDALNWLHDNFNVDDEEKEEDFLDAVSDEFIEDDINESIADEFFANEPALND